MERVVAPAQARARIRIRASAYAALRRDKPVRQADASSPSDRLDRRPGRIRLRPSGFGATSAPSSGGPGTRDGPAWVGFAGCPAPPAEEEIAASRVPAHRLLAGFGQGRRFNPLPLVAPAACRSWPVHDQEPWRSSPLGQTLRRHSQGLSLCPVARTFRSTLDTPRLRIAEQVHDCPPGGGDGER